MDQSAGFIPLWRKIKKSEFYPDHKATRVYVALLIESAYEDTAVTFSGYSIPLFRGQALIGLRDFADEHFMTYGEVRQALHRLEFKYGAISTISITAHDATQFTAQKTAHPNKAKATHLGTLVTILKYDKYKLGQVANSAPEPAENDAPNSAENSAENSAFFRKILNNNKDYYALYALNPQKQTPASPMSGGYKGCAVPPPDDNIDGAEELEKAKKALGITGDFADMFKPGNRGKEGPSGEEND